MFQSFITFRIMLGFSKTKHFLNQHFVRSPKMCNLTIFGHFRFFSVFSSWTLGKSCAAWKRLARMFLFFHEKLIKTPARFWLSWKFFLDVFPFPKKFSEFLKDFSGKVEGGRNFCSTQRRLQILSAFRICAYFYSQTHRCRAARPNTDPLWKWTILVWFSKTKIFPDHLAIF